MSDPPRQSLSTTARAARNARIARARSHGAPWARIAAAEGISVRQAARCAEEHVRATVPAETSDPLDVVRLIVQVHLDSLDRLARLSRSKNLGVAVAAASRAPHVATGLLSVAERVGLVPPPGRAWAFLHDGPAIARALLGAAERCGVPGAMVLAEMETALDGAGASELSDRMNLPTKEKTSGLQF